MKGWRKSLALVVSAAHVAACAASPDSIEARYVSPTTYQNWSCEQLYDEKLRVESEVRRVAGLQKENADADAALMGVGLLLFWPALFGLAATKDRADELGRLKGEYEALEQSIRSKQCSRPAPGGTPAIQTASVVPVEPIKLDGTYHATFPANVLEGNRSFDLTIYVHGGQISGFGSYDQASTVNCSLKGTMSADGDAQIAMDCAASAPSNSVQTVQMIGRFQPDADGTVTGRMTYRTPSAHTGELVWQK